MENNKMNPLKGYITVFFVSLLFFYEFGLNNIFNALVPHIAFDLKISSTTIGLISSIFFYIEILLLIPAGILLDRCPPKSIIVWVICLSAIGVFMTALSHGVTSLILGRILMGIGGTFSFIGCIRIAVNCLHPNQIAKGTGLIVSMGLLGGLIVQLPLTFMIKNLGWRHSLWVVSIIGFIIALLIFLFVKNIHYQENKSEVSELSIKKQFIQAFLNKQNIYCGTYNSLMNLPIFMLGAIWGIIYLNTVEKFTEMQASTTCSMLFLGIMIGSPLAGIISDTVKSRVKPMKIGALLSIMLILIITFLKIQNFYIESVLFLLLRLISSTQNLSYPTVIESNPKIISSSATAVISLLCMLGGAISQPLFGWIAEKLQYHYNIIIAYRMAFCILPIAFIFSYLICFLIKETHCRTMIE